MVTNPNNKKTSLVTKGFGAALAIMIFLAPGAAAQGALDVSGTLHSTTRASADITGATQAAGEILDEVQATAQSTLETVESVKADVNLDVDASVDASGAANGAAEAGTGFLVTAKGYFNALLDGIKGIFGSAKAEAETQVDSAVQSGFEAKSEMETQAYAGADYAGSFEAPEFEAPQPPAPPQVSVSLTASLQAALGGVLSIFA